MTIRTHIADLREQREAYARLLDALESGKLSAGDLRADELRRKIADLDVVIGEAVRNAESS